MTESRESVRAFATKSVEWAPARNSIKYTVHAAARVRGQLLSVTGRAPAVNNIFAASCPKSGSQWVKALFHHPIVRAKTGLFTLPQLDYYERRLRRFPIGTFVPGVYLSYPAYQQIPKPPAYRTVYVFRDPRDIVVSGYFSQLKTHPTMLGLEERRRALSDMSVDEGLLYALDYGQNHLRDMATWAGVEDESVAMWRLEDIGADPAAHVPAIFAHCAVELSPDELEIVMRETSREELQRKDLEQRDTGSESHYRVRREGFRELFTPEHYEAVERVVPGLVEKLGYPA
jgi:hypothetical protein